MSSTALTIRHPNLRYHPGRGAFTAKRNGSSENALAALYDQASLFVCEQLEGNIVFGVGLCEEVVEDGPVVDVDAVLLATIGNGEEDRVLLALDLVL